MLLGECLDRPTYRILHTIGEGAQGVCRRGVHEVFNKDVVQKTVSTFGAPDSAVRVNEPAILKEIKHDRIVEIWEAQWDPDPDLAKVHAVTFVMPYYPEGSVYKALVEGYRFSVSQTIRVAADSLAALHQMHAVHGLVHRDVKPANVLLEDGRRRGCLADLGSAAYIESETGGVSSQVGSPLYQAPEARPSGVTKPVSDVYAVGVMMVEMVNGRFRYEDIDPAEVDARLDDGRRALADRWYEPDPWVPKPLASFIRSLCRRNPQDRPVDAASALRALMKLRVVDWCHKSGDSVLGTWIGYWPPEARRADQRITEVTIEPSTHGARNGELLAVAKWRRPNGPWRNYAKLKDRLDPDRPALARYFRRVEAMAQSAPTR